MHAFYGRNVLQLPTHIQHKGSSSIALSQTEFGCTFFSFKFKWCNFSSYVLICIEVVRTHAYRHLHACELHVAKEQQANTHAHQVDTNCRRCSKDSNAVCFKLFDLWQIAVSILLPPRSLSLYLALSRIITEYVLLSLSLILVRSFARLLARMFIYTFVHLLISLFSFRSLLLSLSTMTTTTTSLLLLLRLSVFSLGICLHMAATHSTYRAAVCCHCRVCIIVKIVSKEKKKQIVFFCYCWFHTDTMYLMCACGRACVHACVRAFVQFVYFFVHSLMCAHRFCDLWSIHTLWRHRQSN